MSKSLSIIGLAGTNGSGKDTVGHTLANQYGYLFISVTELLRDEAKRRGQPVEREILRTISAEWRREYGLGVLIDKAVAQYKGAANKYEGLAVASLRNPGEADRIHELGGTMVWIDADPRRRYERVRANAASRARAAEDDKTFEQFMLEEEAEMHKSDSADEATVNIAGVKARCDIFIENNADNLAAFQTVIKQALGL
jgi:cytidylate kinase